MAAPDTTNFDFYVGYRVAGSGEGGWVEMDQPATVHPYVISGLTSGTTYEFRVRKRRKSNGFSKYSTGLATTVSSSEETGVQNVVMGAGGTFDTNTLIGRVQGTRDNSEIRLTDGQWANNWDYATVQYTDASGVERKYGLRNGQNSVLPTGFVVDTIAFSYTGGGTQDFNIAVLFSIPVVFTLVFKGNQAKTLQLRFPAIASQG